MTTITVWILIITANGYSAAVVDRFAAEADCKASAARLERQSADKKGMSYVYGTCIEAKVIR